MATRVVYADDLDDCTRTAWERAARPGAPSHARENEPAPAREAAAARYQYRDQAGAAAFTVVRHVPKAFTIEAPDGSALPDPVPGALAVLYRLPELSAAPPGETVHICEGERDADSLADLGLIATTMPCGTRMGWQASYTPHLAGRHVVIYPDADGPGRRHAQMVLGAVCDAAASAVICDLHGGSRGPWDVTDWLTGRHRDALLARVARARLESAGYTWRQGGPVKADREAIIWGSTLDSAAKLVLLAICHHTGGQPGALPPASQLAVSCSAHRVTVQRVLGRLRAAGVLAAGGTAAVAWDILAIAQF